MIMQVTAGMMAALELNSHTPRLLIDQILDGSDMELAIFRTDGKVSMVLRETDVAGPDEVDVELGDFLVRIGDDVFVYEPETFYKTFD